MKYTVFVLRGQPFHNAHKTLIQTALEQSDRVIVVLGSYRAPTTIKNPWDFESRRNFINNSLSGQETSRLLIRPLRDFLYSDTTWITSLQNTVASMVGEGDVSLIGHFKDDSSYYLNFFPQWKLLPQPAVFAYGERIDGTLIRERLLGETDKWDHMVPVRVANELDDFKKTDTFKRLQDEYYYIKSYKKIWEVAPFPPTFVTTDAVVVQAGHILLVTRKVEPGKGRYALPGGFLNQDEFISHCAIRELREETKIAVPFPVLERCIKDQHVFDHPKRSLRGRSITHAYLFVLDGDKPLPVVRGDDDAASAQWVPINDLALLEENFFEDHLAIIQYFVNKL
jgi:bifunctional NMN adenylyltransferase/nudix hydrolase